MSVTAKGTIPQKETPMLPSKPKNMLIYYGWLNAFNSAANQWNNEKVAQELAKYDILVFGDGVQSPSHGDYSNTQVILPRIKALNPTAQIFGYVTINQTLADFKTKANQWDTLQADGIFLDEAGYDYGKNRAEFNERVLHVKNLLYATTCMANAWNADHVIGTANDTSYPNSTYNPDGYEALLEPGDWYLLESFAVNTDAYTSSNGYASKTDWKARGDKASALRREFEINMAACAIIADTDQNGQAKFDFCFRAALAYGLDANGSSDSSYGASSAKSKWWTRPSDQLSQDVEEASVTADAGDADKFLRYGEDGRVTLDFSSGSQTSSFEAW